MDKKNGHLTFDFENLAVPEIHTHEDNTEKINDEINEDKSNKADSIAFDNLAMPEIHIRHKTDNQ